MQFAITQNSTYKTLQFFIRGHFTRNTLILLLLLSLEMTLNFHEVKPFQASQFQRIFNHSSQSEEMIMKSNLYPSLPLKLVAYVV